MPKIELKIDGQKYSGWQSLSVVRSIETLSGRFDMQLTDKTPFPVPRSGAVELLLHGQTIITGYSDLISSTVSSDEHTLEVAGRDKTGDLVDCSAEVESQEMLNVTLEEIVEQVIGPFGLTAVYQASPPTPFKKFSFQEETAFEAIERACRLRGVFASSNEKGEVVIQDYGSFRAGEGIYMGQNVLSARSTFNDKDRFSKYTIIGQQPGGANISQEASTQPQGEAIDLAVKRYRPLIVIAEGAVDPAVAQDRAEWEATVRAARSSGVRVTLQGWLDAGGNLWRENSLVRCELPDNGIFGDMLIKEVTFSLDNKNGEKTHVMLVRPDAYLKQPDLQEEEIGLTNE